MSASALAGTGVLQSVFISKPTSIAGIQALREAVSAAQQLSKIAQPRYPLELHANALALNLVSRDRSTKGLWARVVPLVLAPHLRELLQRWRRRSQEASAPIASFVHKLAALARTRYERALFLDNDIRVLQPSLVHSLLSSTLAVADLAMPLDTNRETGAFEMAPPLCSCLVAYHNTAEVRRLWEGASLRLLTHRHPHVRQTDQEMIWFEWTQNQTRLRVLALPEEYYCPLPANAAPQWQTSGWPFSRHKCRSTHMHSTRVQLG